MSYHATLLVGRGEPRKALSLLEGMRSSSDHTVCFDLQRASAHLQLGNDRQTLATTDSCLRLAAHHCLRTLPPILLRRAIANERLGYSEAADTAFIDAFHLTYRSGAITPWLTLPRVELNRIVGRLMVHRPDLAEQIKEMELRASAVPISNFPPRPAPKLTNRETQIAFRLRGAETLAEIATDLSVSRNTVKSQTASLYRKLGASSRGEAVTFLERSGFFEFPG